MSHVVAMPKLGLTMMRGLISKWHKKEGESVKAGELLVEIETDKINSEIEAPADGYVLKILVQEGTEENVLAPLCIIGEKGEAFEISAGEPKVERVEGNFISHVEIKKELEDKLAERILISPAAKKEALDNNIDYMKIKGTGPEGRIVKEDILAALEKATSAIEDSAKEFKISPLAKKIALDGGIDYASLIGTGPEGRIIKEDVLEAIDKKNLPKTEKNVCEERVAGATVCSEVGIRKVPLTGMRKVIAQRLSQSKHDIPHVYFKTSIDATGIMELKNNLSALVKIKTGKSLSINEIIIKATALAIEEFSGMNASLVENEIIYHENINIGMAVSVEKGLMVPVIANASKLSLSEINKAAGNLAKKAREGRLALEEMSGGTFTISNLSFYGIEEFSAIINPPESAILAVGAAIDTPCAQNGQIVIKSRIVLTLSVDHRIIDGAQAAQFMKKLKEILENPYLLLI